MGLVMLQVEIPLTKTQLEIANDSHKIRVLIGGRGIGKSLLAYSMLVQTCCNGPGSSCLIMPIQRQARDAYLEMMAADGIDDLIQSRTTYPCPEIVWKSGHRLEFRSFDNPNRLRGGTWTGLVVADEANNLSGKDVRKIIILKLMKSNGKLFITSTISNENWLWQLFLKGKTKNKLVKSWMYTTPESIQFQGPGGAARLADFKSLLSEYEWQTECMCVPTKEDTAAFPYLENCIVDVVVPKSPISDRKYIMGVDLGRTRDHTAWVLLDDTGLVVLTGQFDLGIMHEVMAQRIGAIARFWGANVVIDATGAGGSGGTKTENDSYVLLYEQELPRNRLQRLYWSANQESQTKRDIISNLMLATERKKILIPRQYVDLIEQCKNYRILAKGRRQVGFGCVEGHDDLCFPAGSLVLTSIGEIPIEYVKQNMLVMTRGGWNRVIGAGQTGEQELYRIGRIIGTSNHPIFCVNRNMYIRLDALTEADEVLVCQEKQLSLMGCGLIEILKRGIGVIENIIGRIQFGNVHQYLYIDISGIKHMAKSLRDIVSIIKMEIEQIIRSTIWNAYQCESIINSIINYQQISAALQNIGNNAENVLYYYIQNQNINRKWHKSHLHQKEENSVLKQQNSCGCFPQLELLYVKDALKHLLQDIMGKLNFVVTPVMRVIGQDNLAGLHTKHAVPVYNLSVDNNNEYFCQGVLVHNCAALAEANWALSKRWFNRSDLIAKAVENGY
jgi:hypothetical protein